MSSDHPRCFDEPTLIPLDGSDRDSLARLLAQILDSARPGLGRALLGDERAKAARLLYDQRRQRQKFLPPELFGEPAWDILLLLYWAGHRQHRLSVSAVCASEAAPATTALRYIEYLHKSGFIVKEPHPTDKRVTWLTLSKEADQKIGQYLDEMIASSEIEAALASRPAT